MKFLVKIEPLNVGPMRPKEGLHLLLATLDYWEEIMKSGKSLTASLLETVIERLS